MRILHVTPYYEDAWAYGGIPRVAATIAQALARQGHEVTVCSTDACDARTRLAAPGGRGAYRPWPEAPSRDGVHLRVFPNLSNTLAYHLQLFIPLGFDAFLRRHAGDFDVAHLHGCHNLPGVLAGRRLRQAGVPYVLAPNGTAPRIERRRLAKLVFDTTLGRHLIPGAARVVAVTQAERHQLLALGVPSAAIRVVPNPVDLAEFEAAPARGRFRSRLGLGSERVVLFLGKLTPRKHVDVLLRAFASLRPDRARLVIGGNDMGAGRALRSLAGQLGLEPGAIFSGLLRAHERLEALADADVVVYPSKDEIFGLVPIEAILCGTPVVVADDSGCGEIIRRTGGGLVVPEGNVEALARAIGRVLDAPLEWRGQIPAARSRVRQLCGPDAVCRQIERVYAELGPSSELNRARTPS